MSTTEIMSLKQFVPFEDLRKSERNNDISVAMGLLYESIKLSRLGGFQAKYKEVWRELSDNKPEIELVTSLFSVTMHDEIWLSDYRNEFNDRPNYKEVPPTAFLENESSEQALERLKLSGLRLNEKGRLEQDINQNFSEIMPELRQQLVGNLAQKYVELVYAAIKSGEELTVSLLVQLQSEVKQTWMESNLWQTKPLLKKVGVSAALNTLSEVQKAIASMDKSQWVQLTDSEVRKLYQFDLSKQRDWIDGQRNLNMVFGVIETMNRLYKKPPGKSPRWCSDAI